MSEPPTASTPPPRNTLPVPLIVAGVAALMILALSFGAFTWWLLRNRSAPAKATAAKIAEAPPRMVAVGEVIEPFNGVDLTGWKFNPAVWSVRDGVISGRSTSTASGEMVWRAEEIEDFELRFRFRLVRGNSGVSYRTNPSGGGYEFEIFTNKTANLADTGTGRERRRLYHPDPPDLPPLDTEWHDGVVIAIGPRLTHQLDGKVICEVTDEDPAALSRGFLALGAAPSTTVEFQDIRLKRLSAR